MIYLNYNQSKKMEYNSGSFTLKLQKDLQAFG